MTALESNFLTSTLRNRYAEQPKIFKFDKSGLEPQNKFKRILFGGKQTTVLKTNGQVERNVNGFYRKRIR